jgi:hypothetical protein
MTAPPTLFWTPPGPSTGTQSQVDDSSPNIILDSTGTLQGASPSVSGRHYSGLHRDPPQMLPPISLLVFFLSVWQADALQAGGLWVDSKPKTAKSWSYLLILI